MTKPTREEMIALTRALIDEGKLIESGWVSLRYFTIPDGASEVQVEDMRRMFFSGAQHVYSSIFAMLESGAEATPNDIERMSSIDRELSRFVAEMYKLAPEYRPGRMN